MVVTRDASVVGVVDVVVAAVEVGSVESGNRVFQLQAHLDELVLDLIDGLLPEVADVHELRL